MAETKQPIMEMVREELAEDPDIQTTELFEKAKEMDSALEDLSLRQFNARYPLQVKRQQASSRKGGRRGGSSGRQGDGAREAREAVRSTLLRFARNVASAEDRGEAIDVVTSVDDYVDELLSDLEGLDS